MTTEHKFLALLATLQFLLLTIIATVFFATERPGGQAILGGMFIVGLVSFVATAAWSEAEH